MAEYNQLTKDLIAQGYTAENHPEYVKVAGGCTNNINPLDNIYGGFEYVRIYADKFVYKTGCGKFVKGRSVIGDISCYGKEHSHENNNPIIGCPFLKTGCEKNFDQELGSILYGGGLCKQCWCECRRTNEEYNYDCSIEFERKKKEEERQRLYQEFKEKHNGRICQNHMFFDEQKNEWHFNYNPKRCSAFCPHGYAYCDVIGKKLSRKKGNVFYDLKISSKIKYKDGDQFSFFDKTEQNEIIKGMKVFKKPLPIDICEAYAKIGKEEILHDYVINHSYERFFNDTIQWEVLNVRAEVKETRDLLQDLDDIKNGIQISHDSDNIEAKKQEKRDRRKKAIEQKAKKFRKMILDQGWNNLSAVDKKNALKVMEESEIVEINKERRAMKDKPREPEQLSLFDMGVGT